MFENEEKRFLEDFNNVQWKESNATKFEDVAKEFRDELNEQATKKYVPIGTVVGLLDDSNKYMIIGFNSATKDGATCDYIACVYPFGLDSNNQLLTFNHEQIRTFYHVGYFDMFGRGYQEKLNDMKTNMER